MLLQKTYNTSAKWDHSANSWWIGEVTSYRWTDNKNKPISNWSDLDTALQWIIDYNIKEQQ